MGTFTAGRLRHRIDIEDRVYVQQDTSGEMIESFTPFLTNIAAEIAPLSAREFLAAEAIQSEISTKITIRYRPGITNKQRAVHRWAGITTYYDIKGVIRDPKTGLEWLTLPVADGVNNG